jgi:hypothetical protein
MTRATTATRAWRPGVAGLLSVALACPAGAQEAASAPAPAVPASATSSVTTVTTFTTVTTTTIPALPREPLPAWTLATLPDDPVPFHGLVNMDNAGLGSGNMLYPTAGLGVIGLLVGVATHAALVGGSRSSQESKIQAAADKVLDPYRIPLAQFKLHDLQERALVATPSAAVAHLHVAKDTPPGDVFVEASPMFAMTPDAAALVLDATVVVRPGPASDKGVQQVLRVISSPRPEPDLQAAWNADGGAALKTTAAALMAQSLDIALLLSRHPADDKQAFKTLRYSFGDRERMERGQLLEETCDHLVIRTLRGALLVVPHKSGAALPDGCPAAPAIPAREAALPAAPASAPAPAASGVSAAAAAPAASAASSAGA